MRRFHYKKNPEHCPGVNIDKLWSLIPSEVLAQAKDTTTGVAPVLDVTKLVRKLVIYE